MVGFDVTCDSSLAPGAFGPPLSLETSYCPWGQGRMPTGGRVHPLFTRHPPYGGRQKNKGGAGGSLTIAGRVEDGEDYDGGGGIRYAALLGEGAAECRLRRDLLRQRALGLPTAAGGAIRASAHRHRHAGDGWDRIGTPRQRA